jgi:hypothetical protein
MEIQQEITEFFERLAEIAEAIQKKLSWMLGIAGLASLFLAWSAYSADSQLWWNILKCGLILLPAVIWAFIWAVLGQLSEAPAMAADLSSDDGLVANLKDAALGDKSGVRRVFGTLQVLRKQESVDVVLETIGSVTLLGNPLFAALAFVMAAVLFMLTITAFIVLLF